MLILSSHGLVPYSAPFYAYTPLYFPAASAGTPSISPTFNAFWDDTSIAQRVVARLWKKYGTAMEDITFTTGVKKRVLARQYICPLSGSGIAFPFPVSVSPDSNWLGTQFAMIRAKVSASSPQARLCSIHYLVNAAGTTIIGTEPTLSVTIPTSPSLTMTGGPFTASDVGKGFVIDQSPNICTTAAVASPASNWITGYTNSSTVTLAGTYQTGSGDAGAKTIRIIKQARRQICGLNPFSLPPGASGFDTSLTPHYIGDPSYTAPPDDTYYESSTGSIADRGREACFLVIEIGAILFTAVSRTYTFRFGDPSDALLVDDPSAGSCGARLQYAYAPSLIL